ncbi:hypothetical protein L0F63_004158 [Massospora cicadina]|nr:hypothetical protein L0F63_004158 [Massospora cicadina]
MFNKGASARHHSFGLAASRVSSVSKLELEVLLGVQRFTELGGWICCSFCKKRWYCSFACQTYNFGRLHMFECPLLNTSFCLREPPQLKCKIHVLRSYWLMLWIQRLRSDDPDWENEAPMTGLLLDTFRSLPSHANSNYTSATLKVYGIVASFVQAQLRHVLDNIPRLKECDRVFEPTISELIDTLKVFSVNNFSLVDSELSAVGEATFPVGSLINHSCIPNCMYYNCYLDDGVLPKLEGGMRGAQSIVTIRHILPGEEITVPYLDGILNQKSRQRELYECYHFRCSCDLCLRNLDGGISLKDPNLSLYKELLPQACYLNWRFILPELVNPLIHVPQLPGLMARLIDFWQPGILIDNVIDLCARKLKASPPPLDVWSIPSSMLEKATKSLISWLNTIHPSQIATAQGKFEYTPLILQTSEHLPLPTGMDTFVTLNQDHDPALPPSGWLGDLSAVNESAFYQTAGRLLSSSIKLATFHSVYANPCHPVLAMRLIELGKLWYNLAPMLSLKACSNEPWVLLSDFLALFYLTMALSSIPKATMLSKVHEKLPTDISFQQRLAWASQIPLLSDLLKTVSDIISELVAILSNPCDQKDSQK